jgi:RecA-family ATPase
MDNDGNQKKKVYKFLEVADFCHIPEAGPKQWAWDGLVPQNEITTIFGMPGSGKSALALGLAIHMACGMSHFLGQKLFSDDVPVLWLDAEMAAEDFQSRGKLAAAGIGKAVPEGRLIYCRINGQLTNVACRLEANRLVKQYKPKVIVVDSYSFAFWSQTENDVSTAVDAITWLKSLKASIVMIEHEAKGGNPKKKTPYGTVFKMAGARSLLSLGLSEDDESRLVIRQTKSNFGPTNREAEVYFDPEQMTFELSEEGWFSGPKDSVTVPDVILQTLKECGQATYDQLVEAVTKAGKKKKSLDNQLPKLLKSHEIVSINHGSYSLPTLN